MRSLIVAVARNRVIGRAGALPWRLPEDLRHFRRTTLDKPIVMGRRTYASIGRPLDRRRNLVLSRDPGFAPPGVEVVRSLEAAFERAADAPETLVIGGASLYAEALPGAERLYLTRIHAEVGGDVFFPEIDLGGWRELERRDFAADARHAHSFSIVTLERRPTVNDARGERR